MKGREIAAVVFVLLWLAIVVGLWRDMLVMALVVIALLISLFLLARKKRWIK